MNKREILEVVLDERRYQDSKWGADRGHEVGAWLALIAVHVQRALQSWAGATGDLEALHGLRKVLALGWACAEAHGLSKRPDWFGFIGEVPGAPLEGRELCDEMKSLMRCLSTNLILDIALQVAAARGEVVTITQEPELPLRMGHYKPVIDVRPVLKQPS